MYVESILGEKNAPLPINIAPPVLIREQRQLRPAAGYPVPVRDDGTIVLPQVPPIPVRGLSLAEAEDAGAVREDADGVADAGVRVRS